MLDLTGNVPHIQGMKPKPLPDQQYLRECFDYNPETGELLWRIRPREHFDSIKGWKCFNTQCAGKIAGTIGNFPYGIKYIRLRPFGTAHRVIWKLVTGSDPVAEIDHKDHDGTNNRWSNLRPAVRSQNARNKLGVAGKSGFKGVDKKGSRYVARIMIDYKNHYLGTFDTAEEAHRVYCEAANRLHKEFASHGTKC